MEVDAVVAPWTARSAMVEFVVISKSTAKAPNVDMTSIHRDLYATLKMKHTSAWSSCPIPFTSYHSRSTLESFFRTTDRDC